MTCYPHRSDVHRVSLDPARAALTSTHHTIHDVMNAHHADTGSRRGGLGRTHAEGARSELQGDRQRGPAERSARHDGAVRPAGGLPDARSRPRPLPDWPAWTTSPKCSPSRRARSFGDPRRRQPADLRARGFVPAAWAGAHVGVTRRPALPVAHGPANPPLVAQQQVRPRVSIGRSSSRGGRRPRATIERTDDRHARSGKADSCIATLQHAPGRRVAGPCGRARRVQDSDSRRAEAAVRIRPRGESSVPPRTMRSPMPAVPYWEPPS